MLKRKVEDQMFKWLEGHKALLVEGARQVGKTFLIRKFCKEYFEMNLLERKDAILALSKANNSKAFMMILYG